VCRGRIKAWQMVRDGEIRLHPFRRRQVADGLIAGENPVQNYTLRNIPQDLWDAITGTMQETGASRRETVIDLIRRGLQSPQSLAHRGGGARQQALTSEQRRALAQSAARARWGD